MQAIANAYPHWKSQSSLSRKLLRDAYREHRRAIIVGLAILVLLNLWLWGLAQNGVLDAAYSLPDGGGYCPLNDSGVSQTVRHDGSIILPASRTGGSYCCGFTFQVAMKVAEERGLLKDKTPTEIRRFQETWYGSSKSTALKECALAVTNLGIGREIPMAQARPGDFVVFHRVNGIGHSVVFLDWVHDTHDRIVGMRYRSSQPDTQGIGDNSEFFDDTGLGSPSTAVRRDRCFVARLRQPWWSRILYPIHV